MSITDKLSVKSTIGGFCSFSYTCAEYPDAWLFSDKLDEAWGGEVAVVIEKSTGAAFYPEAYFAAHPALDPDTPLAEFRVE